jgi:ABC-type antimicrobial peptide transport system permease subunit
MLDDWLEVELASADVQVLTYRQESARAQEQLRNVISTMGLIEIVFTLVTAFALAALNYISVSQRRSELGVLSALGRGKGKLVLRVLHETALTTGVAWGVGIVLCIVGMLAFQMGIFAPLGLRLNLANPIPWLFTLPTPIAVLAVTSGTVIRTLSRLDPVAIIERRQ